MRVLVTGGAGFIGSHVVDALLDVGHEVVVVDNLHPAAHGDRPGYLDDRAELRIGDLADPDVARRAVRAVDAVSHQAARVGLGVDFGDVDGYVRDNDVATAALLRALHDRDFSGPLVVASSMVVYGEGGYECEVHGWQRPRPRSTEQLGQGRWEPGCERCGRPLDWREVEEHHDTDPRNVYAATKLHQEQLCLLYGREHPAVAVTTLRYHNVYGPRMPRDTPYAGVASIFRSALERGEAPQVFEDGGQRRDFVHVRDVARANLLALTRDEAAPGPLNIASGSPRTVLELATGLAEALGDGSPRPRVVGGYRLGDVRHVVASPARARAVLGFEADVPFEEGIREFATAPLR